MNAVLEGTDDPSECADVLEILVRKQLGLEEKRVQVKTTETNPATKKKVAKKAAKKVSKKPTNTKKVEDTPATMAEAQDALRKVAVKYKSGDKAVAVIEDVSGVKTLAECDPKFFSEIVKQANKLVE